MTKPRPLDPEAKPNGRVDNALRPLMLSNLIGQDKIKESLAVLIEAASKRKAMPDHMLFCGPIGFGKTTLAKIVANEMGSHMKTVGGKFIDSPGKLAEQITNLRSGDILLVEELETVHKSVNEVLSSVLERGTLEITIGKGSTERTIQLNLPPFTLIATTTNFSKVDERVRNLMFVFVFQPYDVQELREIIIPLASQKGMPIDLDVATLLARYSNGSPHEATRLLNGVYKYAIARADGKLTLDVAKDALAIMFNIK